MRRLDACRAGTRLEAACTEGLLQVAGGMPLGDDGEFMVGFGAKLR
jgi:hypothetical protein